jgi:hypothetical protein
VHLSCQNGALPCFTANAKYSSAVILGDGSTNNHDFGSYKCIINSPTQILGNSTVLLLNSTGTTTDRVSMVLSHNTDWELSLGGSAHGISNGLYWYNGGYRMVLMPSGYMGLGGITAPVCPLDVGGGNSVTTTTNIAINTYQITLSGGAAVSSSNQGGGPFSATMCARFRSNVWVQDKLYCTSDRRIKTDIEPLDFSLEHYNTIRPVSYRFKNEPDVKLGVIAQEYIQVCSEGVSVVENENMKDDGPDSPAGVQFCVDYTSITMLNTVALKKLITRIEEQQSMMSDLQSMISDLQQRYAEANIRLFELEKHP